jgi:phosphoheptose isomerase
MNSDSELDLDSIERRFQAVVGSEPWRDLERAVIAADALVLFGNGGNLAVSQHAAADLLRLTDKRVSAPGAAVTVTALANEVGFDGWLEQWLRDELRPPSSVQSPGVVVIGLSCSGVSPAVMNALRVASEEKMAVSALITSRPPGNPPADLVIELGASYYHSAEVLMSLLMYQLAVACGGRLRRLE